MRENRFQAKLIKEIEALMPDAMVLKNDAGYKQGIPDILILRNDKWAMLECKGSEKAKHRPNQDYYVDKLNGMSYAAFVYPENKQEVLNALQRSLGAGGKARLPKS